MFPILPFFLIGIAILTFFIKKSDRRQDEEIDGFWDRERKAVLTPAADLKSLPYLNVPIDRFCFGTLDTPEVKAIEDEILEISKKPLLNLTRMTNTELRETYGTPNLEAMKAIGEDFDKLTIALVNYAQALYDAECISLAITVLEYGVVIKTDMSKNYTLLGDCFSKLGQTRRILTLKEQVVPLNLLTGPMILSHLDKLIEDGKETPSENFDSENSTQKSPSETTEG